VVLDVGRRNPARKAYFRFSAPPASSRMERTSAATSRRLATASPE